MHGNFKSPFEPMIEDLQKNLCQGKRKQSKGGKIGASIRQKLSIKNIPKLSAKHLENNISKSKKIQNISATLKTFSIS